MIENIEYISSRSKYLKGQWESSVYGSWTLLMVTLSKDLCGYSHSEILKCHGNSPEGMDFGYDWIQNESFLFIFKKGGSVPNFISQTVHLHPFLSLHFFHYFIKWWL